MNKEILKTGTYKFVSPEDPFRKKHIKYIGVLILSFSLLGMWVILYRIFEIKRLNIIYTMAFPLTFMVTLVINTIFYVMPIIKYIRTKKEDISILSLILQILTIHSITFLVMVLVSIHSYYY